jgi:hypothetical protein
MSGVVLFETAERNRSFWRLEVVRHKGRTFANCRLWWRDKAGDLHPGESGKGFTFPLERLPELRRAIEAWEAGNAPSGPENGS